MCSDLERNTACYGNVQLDATAQLGEEVTFNVNGVDVEIGSTVLFQGEDEMMITTVEGTTALDFEEEVYPAIEGTQLRLPLNEQGLPEGRPGFPESYDEMRVAPLPLRPLPRGVAPPPPLPPGDLETLNSRLRDGQPPCENLPPRLRDAPPLPPDRWGTMFIPGENCIAGDGAQPTDAAQPLPPCPPMERPPRPDGQRLWCIVLPGPDDPPLPEVEDRPICPINEPIPNPDDEGDGQLSSPDREGRPQPPRPPGG